MLGVIQLRHRRSDPDSSYALRRMRLELDLIRPSARICLAVRTRFTSELRLASLARLDSGVL